MTPTHLGYNGPLTIDAVGHPAPKGSKTPIRGQANGAGRAPIVGMRESSSELSPWRDTIVDAARVTMNQQLPELRGRRPLYGPRVPLIVDITVYLRATKAAILLLDRGIECWPTSKPDEDKLRRGVLDALTLAGVYPDDAQVVDGRTKKRFAYGERRPGALIVVGIAQPQPVTVGRRYTLTSPTSRRIADTHLLVAGAALTLCGIEAIATEDTPSVQAKSHRACSRCALRVDPVWTVDR
jgi:Holliday junction resolvase RusA-like endonuclease